MPPVLDGAIYVDFNEDFGFPILYPFVVFEFAWLCVPSKLAFWHSDLLCRLETMKRLADVFEKLKQGETAAVYDMRGRRNLFFRRRHRYWELVGCTTVGAGRDQYETGTGWWRNFADHPMCKDEAERCRRRKHYWDHGSGILYWKRQYGGRVVDIPLDLVREGHCTSINRKDYVIGHGSKKNIELPTDLDANYDVLEVAKRLGIAHLLD